MLRSRTPSPSPGRPPLVALLLLALDLACTAGAGPRVASPPSGLPATAAEAGLVEPPVESHLPSRARSQVSSIIRADATRLVDGEGRVFLPRGVGFANAVWTRSSVPEGYHGEADYAACAALGVNAIRFSMHHRWFETGRADAPWRERGFAWLEQQLAWARAHGIRLLLDLHVPPGGFQSDGGGRALWKDPERQRRFVALWRELARRLRDEPAVLGYDLLHEPVVTTGLDQWEALARRTVAAIREVDPEHLVVVERVNGVYPGGWFRPIRRADWAPDRNGAMNLFPLEDRNVAYELHLYEPIQFTRLGWPFQELADAGTYPGVYTDWDGVERRFDRTRLQALLAPALAFQRRHQVPLFLGEFGVERKLLTPSHNGAGWVSDVLDLADEHGIGVSYHAYDDDAYGIVSRDGYNQALADLLSARYRGAPGR